MPEPLKNLLNTELDQAINIETDLDTFIHQHHQFYDTRLSGIAFLNSEFEVLYSNQYLIELINLDISYAYQKNNSLPLPLQLKIITPAINNCIQTMEQVIISSKLDIPNQDKTNRFLISIQPVLKISSNK